MLQITFSEAPEKVKQYIREVLNYKNDQEIALEWEDFFEGVFDTIEDWIRTRVDEEELQEVVDSIERYSEGFLFDYVDVDGKLYCFAWV